MSSSSIHEASPMFAIMPLTPSRVYSMASTYPSPGANRKRPSGASRASRTFRAAPRMGLRMRTVNVNAFLACILTCMPLCRQSSVHRFTDQEHNITFFSFSEDGGTIDIDEKASITNSKSGKLNSMWRIALPNKDSTPHPLPYNLLISVYHFRVILLSRAKACSCQLFNSASVGLCV